MKKYKRSDFSLFPINKIGKKFWEHRKATWPLDMEPTVHKLFDKKRAPPLNYLRRKGYDGQWQNCKIVKDDTYGLIVAPGNGYNFLIRRDTFCNREADIDDFPFDDEELSPDTFFPKEIMKTIIKRKKKKANPETGGVVLTDLKCLICLTNKRSHFIPECHHLVACKDCAKGLLTQTNKTCPVCRKKYARLSKMLF